MHGQRHGLAGVRAQDFHHAGLDEELEPLTIDSHDRVARREARRGRRGAFLDLGELGAHLR